ncbi:TetR/AcrR family transcriptional regulator [Micromonospora sp. WMMD975]|nr:TetR/AcrR family transcriptional regulator [Micromonospora sp. WMMD975]WFE33525.1 TetR/AcrR family transcriptional regulator [Micromonospora sp. WMMD975]
MPDTASTRGQRTREALCSATVALVAEVGWGNVTTRLVADRAGVPVGAVHYHFRSLSELLIEACTPVLWQLIDEVRAGLGSTADLETGLDWFVTSLTGYAGDPTALRLPSEIFLAATRNESLGARIDEAIRTFREVVTAWLDRCGHGADAEAAATVLAAAMDGLLLYRAVGVAVEPAALAGILRRIVTPPSSTSNPIEQRGT